MHQPIKWWTGLIPLAAVWAGGTAFKAESVEKDLAGRARAAISALPADSVDSPLITAAGRDIRVTGTGFVQQSAEQAAKAMDTEFGVRRVDVELVAPSAAKPYIFSVRRTANQLVLDGHTPLPSARALVATAARATAPGVLVADGLKYATGAPPNYQATAAYAIGEANKLTNGAASISDGAYTISGEAPTVAVYDASMAATRQLPQGLTLAKAEILPPAVSPYNWSATRNAQGVTLTGFAPNDAVRTAIAARAAAAVPGATVTNQLQIARGAPAGDFAAQTSYALGELGKLSGGSVSLANAAYSITGTAPTPAAYDASLAATSQLPQGLTLARAEIQAPEIKPYVWGATRNAQGLTLTGLTPSAAARTAIAAQAAAAFPNVAITNQMQIARGAPAGDFAAQTSYALGELGKLSGGSVNLSDANYSISGAAPSPAAYDAVVAQTKQLPQGLTLARADIQPMEVKPYTWGATRDANGVTLTGYAPSEAARTAIAARAASVFPGVRVTNQMQIARGAPAGDFAAAGGFALTELGKLADGKAAISDAGLSISGTGKPGVNNASVSAEARSGLPQGFAVAAIDIKSTTISPYVFNAEKTEGKLKLSGYYPDQKAHQDIVAAAKSRFVGDAIDDQLAQGDGAPAGFVSAISSGFNSLSRLAKGSLELSGANALLKGEAFYDKAAAQIREVFASPAGQNFKVQSEIVVAAVGAPLDAATCQPKLTGLLAAGKIQFETARADLHKDSTPLLDHIVGVTLRCRGSAIEVAGYTDSDGVPERNLALSKRRAQAVVDYLTEAGVDVSRITAAGYGDERPIASNDTAEGKAQNRRIEMSVK